MEKELVGGEIGKVGKYDVSFIEGKLIAEVDAKLSPVMAMVKVEIDSDEIIEAIKKAIPGKYDDILLDGLKALLKGA